MSRNTKIGCAVLAALGLLSLLVCGGLFFGGKIWVEGTVAELEEMGPQIQAETDELARKGADACVTDGLRRTTQCGDLEVKCMGIASAFTNICLGKVAPGDDAICAGAPPRTEFMKAANWSIAQCERRGYAADDQQCTNFFSNAVLPYCEGL